MDRSNPAIAPSESSLRLPDDGLGGPRSRRRHAFAPALLLTVALAGAGCGASDPAPRWVDLSRGFEPRDLAAVIEEWAGTVPEPARVDLEPDGSAWVSVPVARDAWEPARRPDTWSAAIPVHAALDRGLREARLVSAECELVRGGAREEPVPGSYLVEEDRLFLQVEPGAEPPTHCRYGKRLERGLVEHGRWRVRTRTITGYGLPVYSGSWEELEAEIPPNSELRFATGFSTPAREATFRVRLDGELLWEARATDGEHVAVDLPSARGAELRTARLRFEVEGGGGLGVFFTPVLGPAKPGDYRGRPWGADRPDAVLFLADTFRADNLAAWGGNRDIAPNLNRLVEESRHFLAARSTAAWTFPAVSSVLTGLFPGQHGATTQRVSLSRELLTIAELFGEHGYRTAAITDSAFFSPAFGLDQGFELFVENGFDAWNLDRTIDQALAWLDADDGRPVLLLVHTYRAHAPYRRGADEDKGPYNELVGEEIDVLRAAPRGAGNRAKKHVLDWLGLLAEHYRGGVHDLDRKFERLRRGLEARGMLEEGTLAFFADHGEAFGEHGEVAHGGRLWDSKIAIPIVLHGGRIEPGAVTDPVSLVDVAPTLAELAGIPRDPRWPGASLLATRPARPAFAFRLEGEGREELAIVRGARKVLAHPDAESLRRGEVRAAFELGADPDEESNLAPSEAWPAELAREVAGAVQALLAPATGSAGAEEADVSAELRARLAEIGYAEE